MSSLTTREKLDEVVAPNHGATGRKRGTHLIERIIFGGLLSLIGLAAIPYGTVDPWSIALLECAVFIFGALWLAEGFFSGSWLVSEHRLLLPLIALLGFAVIQTLPFGTVESIAPGVNAARTLSADPFETRLWAYKMGALLLLGAMLLRYTSSPGRLRWLVHFVVGFGVACALLGIMRQTMQRDAPGFLIWARLVPGSGYAQFINRNHFAFLMEMTLGLLLGLIVGRGVSRERLLIYLAAAAPVWVALILANSRGGILTMLIQPIIAVLLLPALRPARNSQQREGGKGGGMLDLLSQFSRSVIIRVVLVVFLAVAGTVSVVWIGGEQLTTRLESSTGRTDVEATELRKGSMRGLIWRGTWNLIKANPIVGVGFGGYMAAIPQYHDATGELSLQQAHNDYLELMASGGIIGVALVVWFIVLFVRRARERLRSPDAFRRAACFGAIIGMLGVSIHSMFDFGLHTTINAVIFTVLAVIAIADGRVEEKVAPRRRSGRHGSSRQNGSSRRNGSLRHREGAIVKSVTN